MQRVVHHHDQDYSADRCHKEDYAGSINLALAGPLQALEPMHWAREPTSRSEAEENRYPCTIRNLSMRGSTLKIQDSAVDRAKQAEVL